jgi:hypothetical protein
MSEIMDDYDAGYAKGLLNGYTESIVLCRSLQRSIVPEKNVHIRDCIIDRRLQWEMLEQAMKLIAQKIEPNNNE